MAEHGMYSRNPEPWTQHRGFAVLGFGAALDTIDRTQGNQTLPMFARIRRISLGETAKVSSNFLSCMFSVTGRANLYEALVLDRVADAAAAAAADVGVDCHFKLAQLPLNAFEGGAVLGRGKAVEAERDCDLATRLGISLVTNRPLNALPMPGVSTGDWGRGGASHLQLREAKPMGTMASLLKRVLCESANLPEAPLQQIALRLALSAPGVACTLNGVRQPAYVEDAAQVLQLEPISHQDVEKALLAVRSLAEELGCDTKQLW